MLLFLFWVFRPINDRFTGNFAAWRSRNKPWQDEWCDEPPAKEENKAHVVERSVYGPKVGEEGKRCKAVTHKAKHI